MNIKDKFYLSEVDHSELSQVLLSHFGSAEGPSLNTHKYIKRDKPDITLSVTYSDEGKIIDISYPDGTAKEIDIISQSIKKNLIENQDISIGQNVCYSVNKKMEGYFTYKDIFQIVPVPEEAPKPPWLVADWPFLLQFRYVSSPNPMISGRRQTQKLNEIILLLHFLTEGIISGEAKYNESGWAVNNSDDSNFRSEWKQLGYMYKGLSGKLSSYSSNEGVNPIGVEPYKDFYDSKKGRMSNSLTLPDNLGDSIDIVEVLDEKDKKRFFNSCHWYYVARQLWPISHSASYALLITALESLIGDRGWEKCNKCSVPLNLKSEERCDSCKEPKYRVVKTFQEFLDKYVPNINTLTGVNGIYDMRSKILHGIELFYRDRDPMNWMDKRQQDEDSFHRAMFDVTFMAMYNWLNK